MDMSYRLKDVESLSTLKSLTQKKVNDDDDDKKNLFTYYIIDKLSIFFPCKGLRF